MEDTKLTSEAVENYLKAIYHLSTRDRGASLTEIARQMGVSASGVSKMLPHLVKMGFAEYIPYRGVRLTEVGRKAALEVIRHHRLLELYLMEAMGYGWDRVHAEAERLEHHISEEFEDRMEQLLGFPEFDPHGDPIPTRDGRISPSATTTLESQEAGACVTVARVTDEDEALLRYLGDRGIRPGEIVELLSREPFGGSLLIRVAGKEERISPDAAGHVFVEVFTASPGGKTGQTGMK